MIKIYQQIYGEMVRDAALVLGVPQASMRMGPANSRIKVIQENWNRPVRSNSHNDPTVVH